MKESNPDESTRQMVGNFDAVDDIVLTELPQAIGRYRIPRWPGNGSFGVVCKPNIVDFWFARREVNIGKGPRYSGESASTSLEQMRNEGCGIDSRNNIVSPGVVPDQLPAGRPPFGRVIRANLLGHVISCERRPLCQFNEELQEQFRNGNGRVFPAISI